MLTDVPGILDADLKTISSLDMRQAREAGGEQHGEGRHDTEDQLLPRCPRGRGKEDAHDRRPGCPRAAPGDIYRSWHRHADSGRIAMQQEWWIEKGNKYLANTYKRFPIGIAKGEGCWLWDMNGRRYLDFLSGIAVCNLGHAPAGRGRGLCAQAREAPSHLEPLLYGAADKGRRADSRALLRGQGLLLQQRRRGQRGRHQACQALFLEEPRRGQDGDRRHGELLPRAGPWPPCRPRGRASSRWASAPWSRASPSCPSTI